MAKTADEVIQEFRQQGVSSGIPALSKEQQDYISINALNRSFRPSYVEFADNYIYPASPESEGQGGFFSTYGMGAIDASIIAGTTLTAIDFATKTPIEELAEIMPDDDWDKQAYLKEVYNTYYSLALNSPDNRSSKLLDDIRGSHNPQMIDHYMGNYISGLEKLEEINENLVAYVGGIITGVGLETLALLGAFNLAGAAATIGSGYRKLLGLQALYPAYQRLRMLQEIRPATDIGRVAQLTAVGAGVGAADYASHIYIDPTLSAEDWYAYVLLGGAVGGAFGVMANRLRRVREKALADEVEALSKQFKEAEFPGTGAGSIGAARVFDSTAPIPGSGFGEAFRHPWTGRVEETIRKVSPTTANVIESVRTFASRLVSAQRRDEELHKRLLEADLPEAAAHIAERIAQKARLHSTTRGTTSDEITARLTNIEDTMESLNARYQATARQVDNTWKEQVLPVLQKPTAFDLTERIITKDLSTQMSAERAKTLAVLHAQAKIEQDEKAVADIIAQFRKGLSKDEEVYPKERLSDEEIVKILEALAAPIGDFVSHVAKRFEKVGLLSAEEIKEAGWYFPQLWNQIAMEANEVGAKRFIMAAILQGDPPPFFLKYIANQLSTEGDITTEIKQILKEAEDFQEVVEKAPEMAERILDEWMGIVDRLSVRDIKTKVAKATVKLRDKVADIADKNLTDVQFQIVTTTEKIAKEQRYINAQSIKRSRFAATETYRKSLSKGFDIAENLRGIQRRKEKSQVRLARLQSKLKDLHMMHKYYRNVMNNRGPAREQISNFLRIFPDSLVSGKRRAAARRAKLLESGLAKQETKAEKKILSIEQGTESIRKGVNDIYKNLIAKRSAKSTAVRFLVDDDKTINRLMPRMLNLEGLRHLPEFSPFLLQNVDQVMSRYMLQVSPEIAMAETFMDTLVSKGLIDAETLVTPKLLRAVPFHKLIKDIGTDALKDAKRVIDENLSSGKLSKEKHAELLKDIEQYRKVDDVLVEESLNALQGVDALTDKQRLLTRNVGNVTTFSLMLMTGLSALAETGQLFAVKGPKGKAMWDSLHSFFGGKEQFERAAKEMTPDERRQFQLMVDVGLYGVHIDAMNRFRSGGAIETVINEGITVPGSVADKLTSMSDNLASLTMRLNLLAPLTNWQRRAGGIAAGYQLPKDLKEMAKGSADAYTVSYLHRLGVDQETAKVLSSMLERYHIDYGDIRLPNISKWNEAGMEAEFELYMDLIRRLGDEALVIPGALNQSYVSRSILGKFPLGLMTWSMSVGERMIGPLLQRGYHQKDVASVAALASIVVMSIVSESLREIWRGNELEYDNEMMVKTFSRSPFAVGWFSTVAEGIIGPMFVDNYEASRRNYNVSSIFLGPAGSAFNRYYHTVSNLTSGDWERLKETADRNPIIGTLLLQALFRAANPED